MAAYASDKLAIAECDRCGWQYKKKKLKEIVKRGENTNWWVCPECWETDHPQNFVGLYPVSDPQAIRNPRPDTTYVSSGLTDTGSIGGGSRVIEWGWNPVGMVDNDGLTPNALKAIGSVGDVTVTTS
jgi:hypothetical protein|tara:strand:- start:1085 stop:1465 length:381 start_codon:yes stop_codon:yes gene_type:complete